MSLSSRLVLALVLVSCGAGKPQAGKSVVVTAAGTDTPVKNGTYEVGYTNGFIQRFPDGGIFIVTVNALLTPPGGGSSGITAVLHDPSAAVGKAQTLGAVSATSPQFGYIGDPLGKVHPIWAATAGTLTVTSFDPQSIALTVAGAQMAPVPGQPDGGATGTFTLDVDVQVKPLTEL